MLFATVHPLCFVTLRCSCNQQGAKRPMSPAAGSKSK